MTDPLAPFLSIDDFETQYGKPLGDGDTNVAERLLRVVSARIRSLSIAAGKPVPDPDAAQQVTFEVVRDAVAYGAFDRLSSFQNITSRRQEAGAFDEDAKLIDDYFLPRHRQLLGLAPLKAAPRGSFKKCDY